MMRKTFWILCFMVFQRPSVAQLPLQGDTVVYSKINKNLKELLPAAINFLTNKSKINDIKAVYKNTKFSKINNELNFTLVFEDKSNAKIKYIAGGNVSDELIEAIRVSFDAKLFTAIFPNIGSKTVTDKGADYWFLITKDQYKVFFVLNKMGNNYVISIGIRPKNWVHLAKK